MKESVRPKPTPNRGKWITLALLTALAALTYVAIMIKVVKLGF